jgi:hypothetical protein
VDKAGEHLRFTLKKGWKILPLFYRFFDPIFDPKICYGLVDPSYYMASLLTPKMFINIII